MVEWDSLVRCFPAQGSIDHEVLVVVLYAMSCNRGSRTAKPILRLSSLEITCVIVSDLPKTGPCTKRPALMSPMSQAACNRGLEEADLGMCVLFFTASAVNIMTEYTYT